MNEELWNECVRFHGHSCPGLAMGFRAAGIAMEELGILPSKDEEIVCISENDACGVDAIQCITSCTAGKGNLIFRITGKHAYSFFDRKTGNGIRVVMKTIEHNADSKDEFMEFILSAPADEIFDIKEPTYDIPETARMYDSVICEECKEPFREDLAVRKNGKTLCKDCSLY